MAVGGADTEALLQVYEDDVEVQVLAARCISLGTAFQISRFLSGVVNWLTSKWSLQSL